jgi:hypothetical protein
MADHVSLFVPVPGVRVPTANRISLLPVLFNMKARFEPPKPGEDDRTILYHLLKTAPPLQVLDEKGSLAAGEKLATHVVEETKNPDAPHLQPLRPPRFGGRSLTVKGVTESRCS